MKAYLQRVTINCRPEPRPFGEVAEPWQWASLDPMVPALEFVAGVRMPDHYFRRSFLRVWPRGHDKTGAIGRILNWLLLYAKRPLNLYTAAGDTDQAHLIVESMQMEATLNPWLRNRIRFTRKVVRGPGGVLNVLSSDAPTAYGLTPDVMIFDEITHWEKDDLWNALYSGRGKRPGSVVIIITNSGQINSWQHRIYREAKEDLATWDTQEAPIDTQMASWMSAEEIAKIRRMLPRGLARRVLDNRWTDPAEEADYITRAEIVACQDLGRALGLVYQRGGNHNTKYFGSIDYGPRRDRTVCCVGHLRDDDVLAVDRMDVFQGSSDSPVLIATVEDWVREITDAFNYPKLWVDPYQMEGSIQKWELTVPVERFEARGGKSNYQMAETLRSLLSNTRVAWYPGAGTLIVEGRQETLVDELAGLVIKTTPYGYRFDHTAKFHDDRAVALGMLALGALKELPSVIGSMNVEPVKVVPSVPLNVAPLKSHTRGLWGMG